VQFSTAQVVPTGYVWQPPPPSHFPLVAHEAAPWSAHIWRGSGEPTATSVHLPMLLLRLQLRQAPVQALSQQTPSTQWLFWHSPSVLQVWPSGFGPQLSFTQAVLSAQSTAWVATVQDDVHAPFVQRNGAQVWASGGWQVP